VIPKAPARNIIDISPEDFAHVARAAHKIASAAMKAFKADGITVQQFNEPAGGQVVFHLHVHVMPRYDGIALLPPASHKEDGKVLEENAAKLVAALKGA
jgi:histidine triad (HIT) family protein